jgi:hypothetical protein
MVMFILVKEQQRPETGCVDRKAIEVQYPRPIMYGNPAFLSPPPEFWFIIDVAFRARFDAL